MLGEGNFGKVYDVYNSNQKIRKVVKIFANEETYKYEKEIYSKIEKVLGEKLYHQMILPAIAFDDKFLKIYFE